MEVSDIDSLFEKVLFLSKRKEIDPHTKDKIITEMTIHQEDIIDIFMEDSDRIDLPERSKLSGVSILIHEGEGPIPHFHLENSAKNFYCAVRLDKAEYFKHNKYQDELNAGERKVIYKFLKEPMDKRRNKDFTRWDHLVVMWNSTIKHNKSKTYCKTLIMPNYRELK